MNLRSLRSVVCLCVPALLALNSLPAQESPPAAAREASAADDQAMHKVNGIFDTDLPKTERKGSIRFIVHPHLGDFTSR
ncbi:MAG: hypothetical protein PSW75_05560, partial [bacterium]|nr:hypothetical protein [bacterium]